MSRARGGPSNRRRSPRTLTPLCFLRGVMPAKLIVGVALGKHHVNERGAACRSVSYPVKEPPRAVPIAPSKARPRSSSPCLSQRCLSSMATQRSKNAIPCLYKISAERHLATCKRGLDGRFVTGKGTQALRESVDWAHHCGGFTRSCFCRRRAPRADKLLPSLLQSILSPG